MGEQSDGDDTQYGRRDVLRWSAGALVPASVVHPTPDGTGDGATPHDHDTATPSSDAFAPMGEVEIEGAKEAVVGDDGTTIHVAATTGFATVDVSDPREPRLLAERRNLLADRDGGPLGLTYDATVDGDRLLVVGPADPLPTDEEDPLRAAVLYDVSDPADPERVAVHETDHPIHNCFLADDVAYLTGNDRDRNPLVMLDASDTGALREVGRWSLLDANEDWAGVQWFLRPVHDIWVQDGVAYLAHWDAGTWLVDVSDPAAPEAVGKLRGRPPEALNTLDDTQARWENLEPPGNDHYVTVDEDASLLVLGVESWDHAETDHEGGPGGLTLWDISTPTDPTRLSTIDPPPTDDPTFDGTWTTSHNFDLVGDRLYTSWYRGGVRLYDVSDPTDPERIAAWRDTESTSIWTAQAVDPGSFYVASSWEGLDGSTDPARLLTMPEPAIETGTGEPAPGTAPGPGVLGGLAGLGLGLGAWRWHRKRGE